MEGMAGERDGGGRQARARAEGGRAGGARRAGGGRRGAPGGTSVARVLGRILLVLFVLVLLGIAVAAYVVLAPYGGSVEKFVDIPSGTGALEMGSLLESRGVIRSRYGFDLLRVLRKGRLRAGEYRFDHAASALEVYRRIVRGDVYTRTVVIPEGYNIFDIAGAVEAAGLLPAAEFLAAERSDTALVADLVRVPPASLEGFLFPDTYRFSRHTTSSTMLATMVRRFRQKTAGLGVSPGENLERAVTIASIVEKEVGVGGERPLVASVFENRLRAGMPLQTDPTVIYAALLDGRYRGTIYASDLHAASAYNTYAHAGLPPGPICSPGLASLAAALHPAETSYLYFVSDAAGHSVFSTTLGEHQRHVAAYRAAAGR